MLRRLRRWQKCGLSHDNERSNENKNGKEQKKVRDGRRIKWIAIDINSEYFL